MTHIWEKCKPLATVFAPLNQILHGLLYTYDQGPTYAAVQVMYCMHKYTFNYLPLIIPEGIARISSHVIFERKRDVFTIVLQQLYRYLTKCLIC